MLSADASPPDQRLRSDRLTLVEFQLWWLPPAGAAAEHGVTRPEERDPALAIAGPAAWRSHRAGELPTAELQAAKGSTPDGSVLPPLPTHDDREEAQTATAPCLGALRAAMDTHLKRLGHGGAEPLRWAITAVDRQQGLRIEGIALWTPPEAGEDADSGEAEAGERRR